jgi:hypothetical protein|tara:strand:- start:819 stop:1151 length:333 start_codon:yes stop_codon:yes gene_type:complete
MAMRTPGRKMYKTAQGKHIDLDLLISRNELTPAVGNARVNARGDELGPGGTIIRKREDIMSEYYQNPETVKDEEVVSEEVVDSKDTEGATAEETAEWIEDDEGNFIKKGE